MSESHGSDTGLDLRGLALISAGAFGIVWGLVRANEAGWGSVEVLACLAGGLALVGAFVAWERRAPEPMIPLSFFRNRGFAAGNGAVFFTFARCSRCVFLFAQFLQTVARLRPLETGLRLMPWTITFILVAPAAGRARRPDRRAAADDDGLRDRGGGLGWLALIADAGIAYSQLLGPFIVAGIGVSLAIPSGQNAVVRGISLADVGKAAGANSMMRELGGVFGIAVVVAVFAGAGSYASAAAFTDGFAPAVGVAAGLSLIGALIATALPAASRQPSQRNRSSRTALEGARS